MAAAVDTFQDRLSGLESPVRDGFAVSTSDSVDVVNVTRALWVGGAGNLTVIMVGAAESVTLTAVPAGTWLPLRVTRVMATGTSATNIVGFF